MYGRKVLVLLLFFVSSSFLQDLDDIEREHTGVHDEDG